MAMSNQGQKVVVIGHRNPDTDSVCAAICYAELKNREDHLTYEPRRAGKLNRETAWVLKRFGVEPPRMCTELNPKIRNVEYRHISGLKQDTSIRAAWEIMRDENIDSLAVVDEGQELLGLITVQSIAMANMDVFDNRILAKSGTSVLNILNTLSGTMVTGSAEGVVDPRGKVVIGTASPDVLEQTLEEGDIVILSNRYESQLCAIEMGVSMLIVCMGEPVPKTIIKQAEKNHVAIMSVPCDTYAAGKLISQCASVGYYMQTEGLMTFNLITPVEDAVNVMARVRYRYFPILDENNKYCGMLSRRNVLKVERRKMILVDHNEKSQAVEGFEQGEILEIIDHHRIGSMETRGPVYFRNQALGSTCSIIAQIYDEHEQEITPQIAGLLMSAILSDTLNFTSPTCTPLDKVIAHRLADIAGVNIEEFVEEMFTAAENMEGRSAEDFLTGDFKAFTTGDNRFGVTQGNFQTVTNLNRAAELVSEAMERFRQEQNLEDIYVMLTDIRTSATTLLYSGKHAENIAKRAFEGFPEENGRFLLEGVVSRKKQVLPRLMEAYQEL